MSVGVILHICGELVKHLGVSTYLVSQLTSGGQYLPSESVKHLSVSLYLVGQSNIWVSVLTQ